MIYCVEDDSAIRDIEVYALRSTGFEAEGLESGEQLFEAIKKQLPELIILDVMLPGEDGLEILRRIRQSAVTRSVPVIMACARRGVRQDNRPRLRCGRLPGKALRHDGNGVPCARSAARAGVSDTTRERSLSLGALTLDPSSHTVTAAGQPVTLTLKEFELLRTMMAKPGVVFTRDRLLSEVWGTDYDGETRTVDVHIRTLRQKLGECGAMIGTVRGVGYRMEANP